LVEIGGNWYPAHKNQQKTSANFVEIRWTHTHLTQTMQGADPRAMTMIGFVLYDETGSLA
jgi:hypothetical protein